MSDFMNSPSMNYLRVANATGELATGTSLQAEVVGVEPDGMATLRIGRQQVRVLPDRPVEVGQQLTVRLSSEGGQLRLAILRGDAATSTPTAPSAAAPPAPEVNLPVGQPTQSSPTDALLQELGLPVNAIGREAVEALLGQDGTLSRGNVAAVISAAAEAFPQSPSRGVQAAAFLVSRGVPPEAVLVRAVGQMLSTSRFSAAGLPGEVIAAARDAVGALRQVGIRMPAVESMLARMSVDPTAPRAAARLSEAMRMFQDGTVDSATKNVEAAIRMSLNRSSTLVRIDYVISRIRLALGQSSTTTQPASVSAQGAAAPATTDGQATTSVRVAPQGATGEQALLNLPVDGASAAEAIPDSVVRQARAVVRELFAAMDNRTFQGPGFNLPETSAELNNFLRTATGALSSRFRGLLETALAQVAEGRPEAVSSQRAGMMLRTLPELDVLATAQKLVGQRMTAQPEQAAAATVSPAVLTEAVEELAELFRGPVNRQTLARLEQWVRGLDPGTLRQVASVLRMSVTGARGGVSAAELSALNQLWSKVPALEVLSRTYTVLREPIANPLITNAISEGQFLEQTARAAYSGVTRAFQHYVADMVRDRSPEMLLAMERDLATREAALVNQNEQVPLLRRLEQAMSALRDETVAFKAAGVLRSDDQPAIAFGHLALDGGQQRLPMVVRIKARFPRQGGRPPEDDATTMLLDVQTSHLGSVAAFMVAEQDRLDTTFFVERPEVARLLRIGHAGLVEELEALGFTPTVATRVRARKADGSAPPEQRDLFGTRDLPDLDIIA